MKTLVTTAAAAIFLMAGPALAEPGAAEGGGATTPDNPSVVPRTTPGSDAVPPEIPHDNDPGAIGKDPGEAAGGYVPPDEDELQTDIGKKLNDDAEKAPKGDAATPPANGEPAEGAGSGTPPADHQ